MSLDLFEEVWCVDFEFRSPDGCPVEEVRCLVATEFHTGQTVRLWRDEMGSSPPYRVDDRALFVAYAAEAELSCHLHLGWEMPARVLDLYFEYCQVKNGHDNHRDGGRGPRRLIDALRMYGIEGIDTDEKESLRGLAMREGASADYTNGERRRLLAYCETDVAAIVELLPRMGLQYPYYLLRGRYALPCALMYRQGIPLDPSLYDRLVDRWEDLVVHVVDTVNEEYQCFEGTSFRHKKFGQYLLKHRIAWPRTEKSGRLVTKDRIVKDMCRVYPQMEHLRAALGLTRQLRRCQLHVGSDYRNRVSLLPFGTVTSRHAPKAKHNVLGQSAWLRHIIQAPPGNAIISLDYSQQEFGIAAALSGDEDMKLACRSGDCYMHTAILAGAAPKGATKATHRSVRAQFKTVVLGTGYGMGCGQLAVRLACTEKEAAWLLAGHRRAYPRFWEWAQCVINLGQWRKYIRTSRGWIMHVTGDTRALTIRNFPMQANGQEILRRAICLLQDAGIDVCAPLHDQVLVECRIGDAEEVRREATRLMKQAGREVLDGFEIGVDGAVIPHPQHYEDERGTGVWELVQEVLRR